MTLPCRCAGRGLSHRVSARVWCDGCGKCGAGRHMREELWLHACDVQCASRAYVTGAGSSAQWCAKLWRYVFGCLCACIGL